MKRLLVLAFVLLPLQAQALEYRNLSLLYTDAPFIPAEAAGISLLTSLKAVKGNPDGTFRPNRTLNRAEFLKIALSSYPKIRVSKSDSQRCFPDVSPSDWFAPYVCLAKKRGMVGGYPDGTFKPERSVNYAEALKIMGELYDYVAYAADGEEWYAGYVRAATFHKTALPSSIKFDRPLTRGQMARLAAAFRAHYEEELPTYRLAEKNLNLVIAKEIAERTQQSQSEQASSASSSVSSSISSSSSSSVSSIAPPAPRSDFPARSKFLLLGERHIIGSAEFAARDDDVVIENIQVEFRKPNKNVRTLYLVNENKEHIAELSPDTFDKDELRWKAQGENVTPYALGNNTQTFGIQALMKDATAGFSEELIELKSWSMNVRPQNGDGNGYQLIPQTPSFPAHQTARAEITAITNNQSPVLDIKQASAVTLAEVEVTGRYLEGATLRVKHLTFTVEDSSGITLESLRVGALHSSKIAPCSISNHTSISCSNISASIGVVETDSVVFQLKGTLKLDPNNENPKLRIGIQDPGSLSTTSNPGTIGHVQWTDGTGSFTWVDFAAPVMNGSQWK